LLEALFDVMALDMSLVYLKKAADFILRILKNAKVDAD
jgi:hypothetical protein